MICHFRHNVNTWSERRVIHKKVGSPETAYLKGGALFFHDLDNRLKDIMDALQGRAGGSKKKRILFAVIPNDRQVFRVVIEMSLPPEQSKGYGHLLITKYGSKKSQD